MTPPPRHPASRPLLLALGIVLIVASPAIGILPGPGGIFVFAAGLVLTLRESRRARRRWAMLKRRWPRVGHAVDLAMRRGSALRRRERAQAVAARGGLD